MSAQLQGLKAHLAVVKQSPADKIDDDFFNFMTKAKDQLGQSSYPMAQFYYEYANFILQKIQSTTDIFGDNAIPNNVHDEQEELENIPEDLSEDSLQSDQNPEEEAEFIDHQAGEQELNNQPEIVEGEVEKGDAANQPEAAQEDQPEDDKDICACHLGLAVQLYESELNSIRGGNSSTPINQVLDGLRRARTRLGDLYMTDENYEKCVEYYQSVIDSEAEREGFESSRLISNLYYLIGSCYLYDNKTGCEAKAISQFIKSTNILLGHLSIQLGYDISTFDIPSEEKPKVERFHYMTLPGDSEDVKEIKDVLNCLLDKLEDTHGQMISRDAYEAEKKKSEEQKKLSQFKPVADTTKVVNLGSFGNRKRKPEDLQLGPSFKENVEINALPTDGLAEKSKVENSKVENSKVENSKQKEKGQEKEAGALGSGPNA